MTTVELVDVEERGVRLEVLVQGDDPDVVLLASANRDVTDFRELMHDLHRAGFDSAAINLRTIGRSTGPSDGLTLRDLAEDVFAVIGRLSGRPVHIVGHAFGNTVARATAAYCPEGVASVALLACGGHDMAHDPPSDEWFWHFRRCQETDLPDEDRIESLQFAFFAPGNDASAWLSGWWPDRLGLASILDRSDPTEWWQGGDAPMLLLQPIDDVIGPPRVGRALSAALGERARYRELAQCGHAILPEQPAAVAAHLIRCLRDLAGDDGPAS
jgi:pimeloyl-ACP methyl ester carboxylesterase